MRSRVPVARANRLSVLPDGMLRPLSMRAIALCDVSIFAANSSCVRPARDRAAISSEAKLVFKMVDGMAWQGIEPMVLVMPDKRTSRARDGERFKLLVDDCAQDTSLNK